MISMLILSVAVAGQIPVPPPYFDQQPDGYWTYETCYQLINGPYQLWLSNHVNEVPCPCREFLGARYVQGYTDKYFTAITAESFWSPNHFSSYDIRYQYYAPPVYRHHYAWRRWHR